MRAFWVFILLPAALAAGAEDTAAAPGGWGAECGDPIDAGFFFWNGRYVRAPYTVERKGLDILINGITVSRGPRASCSAPNEDPGEPPPGAGPFDQFFSAKWRYLSSRLARDEAAQRMLEAYQKCAGFSAEAAADGAIKVTENNTGEETYIALSDSWKMAPSSPEQILAGRTTRKRYFEQLLRRNRVVSLFDGGEHILAGNDARAALSVLLSQETAQEKIRDLERRGVLKPGDTAAQCLVTEYREDAQLAERCGRLLRREPLAERAAVTDRDSPPAAGEDAGELAQPAAAPSQAGATGAQARGEAWEAPAAPWRYLALAALFALVPGVLVLRILSLRGRLARVPQFGKLRHKRSRQQR